MNGKIRLCPSLFLPPGHIGKTDLERAFLCAYDPMW